jgi:hypothetical protein
MPLLTTTRSSVRPATPEDAPAVRSLMKEAGLKLAHAEARDFEWKYWRERADWPGPRSFVMTRGEELLAHAGVVPGACLMGQSTAGARRVRTLHLIDWAARPSATGAGVSLLKYLGQHTDALLAVGGSLQTLQLLPHLGFRRLGAATCLVRSLHPLRIVTPSAHPLWRLVPRLARSLLWKVSAPSGGTVGWDVRRIESGDLSDVTSVLPTPLRDMAVFERGVDLFRYVLACPIAATGLYLMERAGQARGYFLLSFARRQARLADYWMASEDPADWRALIQCAVREAFKHPRAAELAVWASDASSVARLQECGFHVRGTLPVQMLAPRNPELATCTLRVQMLDNDALYLHGERNAFWT